jgi:hypothetical protein
MMQTRLAISPPGAFALLFLLALTCSACSTFDLVDGNFTPKGKRLAVVAGLADGKTALIAGKTAEILHARTRFEILPAKQVAQTVPHYPPHIKGPYATAYFDIDEDYGHTDIRKIAAIQQKLGVQYLYVLWVPVSSYLDDTYSSFGVIGQLFEFPGGKEVGRAHFRAMFSRSDPDVLRKALDRAADDFVTKTGMRK